MCKLVMFLALWATAFKPSFEDAVEDFAVGNHKFTADIYKGLSNGNKGNLIICPLSAETVLSLTAEGAKGATAKELFNGVDLPNNTNDRHDAFESILPGLKESSPTSQLSIATRIYVSQRYDIKKPFKNTAARVYQSDVKNINFYNRQQAADIINSWVESQTNDKIQNLINPDSLSQSTSMVLVNTIYLKAKWVTPFDVGRTAKEPFYGWDGTRQLVDTMHSKNLARYKYFHCGFYNAKFLEIPLNNSHVSVTFILPDDSDSYSNMENDIEPYLAPHNLRTEEVNVAIPKFSTTTTNQLDSVLRQLGVKRPFTPLADFSGISDGPSLHIDSVTQKAFINVTETGIEAAGATSVSISPTVVVRPPRLDFIANHPFAYYMRDNDSGCIIFVGRYNGL